MIINNDKIPHSFLLKACEILADTNKGLSGTQIVDALNAYASDNNVTIPHFLYPFHASSKRTALLENLTCFPKETQFQILKDLCEHRAFSKVHNEEIAPLKAELISKFSHLSRSDQDATPINTLIEETLNLLNDFPNAQELYSKATQKYYDKIFIRNLLDDLRLSLELLLKHTLKNKQPLEKQQEELGKALKNHGRSKEFSNMFSTLIKYYATYQNTYIKHDDAVKEEEIEFIFDISSSFIKHITKLR